MSGVLRLFYWSWLGLITCLDVDWLLANPVWPHLGCLGWLAVSPVSFIHQQASFSMVSQWWLRARTASRDIEALFKPLISLFSVDQGKLEGGALSQNGRTLKAVEREELGPRIQSIYCRIMRLKWDSTCKYFAHGHHLINDSTTIAPYLHHI